MSNDVHNAFPQATAVPPTAYGCARVVGVCRGETVLVAGMGDGGSVWANDILSTHGADPGSGGKPTG